MRKPHWETFQHLPGAAGGVEHIARLSADAVARLRRETPIAFNAGGLDFIQQDIAPLLPEDYGDRLSPTGMVRYLLFLALFRQSGARIYKVAQEFGEILHRTKLTVQARVLPREDQTICIEFPDDLDLRLSNGSRATCAYLTCVHDLGRDSRGFVIRRIEIQVPFEVRPGMDGERWARALLHFYDDQDTLERSIGMISGKNPELTEEIIKFTINCLLYVHSGDPDLREYRPPQRPLSKKPKVQRRYGRETADQSLLAMTLVGFEWKKERQYRVDETVVAPHFQGYWCGVGRTRLEIRAKDATLRRLKADDNLDPSGDDVPAR